MEKENNNSAQPSKKLMRFFTESPNIIKNKAKMSSSLLEVSYS